MFSATLYFWGLALCILAGLICYSLARSIKTVKAGEMPADEKAAWEQIKTALLELHARYETAETPRQKALRSWAGTLLICAGLCLIGVLMEVEYDRLISPDSIFSGFMGETQVQQCVKPAATHPLPARHPAQPAGQPAATKPTSGK